MHSCLGSNLLWWDELSCDGIVLPGEGEERDCLQRDLAGERDKMIVHEAELEAPLIEREEATSFCQV